MPGHGQQNPLGIYLCTEVAKKLFNNKIGE